MSVAPKISEAAQVVLSAAGYGVVRLGPGRAGLTWHVTSVAVRIVSATAVPEVHLYLGEPSPGNELTNSYNGANNSSDLDVILASGQYLTAEWIGGDPGARATLSIYGERV